jgi:hypothetical protein
MTKGINVAFEDVLYNFWNFYLSGLLAMDYLMVVVARCLETPI